LAHTKPVTTQVYIGLGSNMKEPLAQLKQAVAALRETPGISNITCSSVYQTEPMGPSDQPDYINAVVLCNTTLSAIELLDRTQLIENRAGRIKDRRWGPRSLDLDLLLYGQEMITSLRLCVPHTGIADRSFVLYPLAELTPSIVVQNLASRVYNQQYEKAIYCS